MDWTLDSLEARQSDPYGTFRASNHRNQQIIVGRFEDGRWFVKHWKKDTATSLKGKNLFASFSTNYLCNWLTKGGYQ